METRLQKTAVLSNEAQVLILEMREGEGFDSLIEVIYCVMKELIQDKDIGGKKNRLYLNHLVDVIDMANLLKQ